jgi:hypothetical protein
MVLIAAAIALGAMIFGFASVTGLTSLFICSRSDEKNNSLKSSKDPSHKRPEFHVAPNDPYYFTEPVVRSETLPFLTREAQLRHGYVAAPEV